VEFGFIVRRFLSMAVADGVRHVSALRGVADPFGERSRRIFQAHRRVLGARLKFTSDSAALMRLVDLAYGGLPPHRLSVRVPRLRVQLRLAPGRETDSGQPPRLRMHGGDGVLCGVMDGNNFAVVSPASGAALVVISRTLLQRAYYARYELIEFAVYMLAARAQRLVSLHAACIGEHGRGVLLIGSSGAGKSTLVLHGMLDGLALLSEDSIFVVPSSMLASGIGTFLHVRTDALPITPSLDRWIRRAPVIRRRSGARKFEVDLRRPPGRISRTPQKIAGIVFLTKRAAGTRDGLLPLDRREGVRRLSASQAYAVGQPGWREFARKAAQLPMFELRRTTPEAGVRALRQVLDQT
jgi:hypothetical protein